MNDKQLTNFLLIAEEGSFSKAANRAFIAVPSLKKQMDMLEAELNCQLFERSNRGVCVTESGKAFLDYAREATQALTALHAKLDNIRRMTCVHIGFNSDHMRDATYYQAIEAFKKQYPHIHVMLEKADCFDPNHFDIFLGYCGADSQQVFQRLLTVLPLTCLVRKEDPLASKDVIRLSDLKGRRLFLPTPVFYNRISPNLVTALKENGITDYEENLQDPSTSQINSMVSNMISIIIGKEYNLPQTLRQIPLQGFSFQYMIYYSQHCLQYPHKKTYLDFICAFYQNAQITGI